MAVPGVQKVRLDLEGNFPSAAGAGAAAGDKLGSSLDRLGSSMDKVKMPSLVSEGARLKALQKDADDAAAAMGRLKLAEQKAAEHAFAEQARNLEKMKAAQDKLNAEITAKREAHEARRAKGAFSIWEATMKRSFPEQKVPVELRPKGNNNEPGLFSRLIGFAGDVFGPKAAVGLRDGATSLVGAAKTLEPIMPLLKAGGAAIAGGAALLAAAAAAVVGAAAALTAAVVKFGVAQTTFRETTEAVIGARGYKATIDLAARFNLDSEAAAAKVKELLSAKFKDVEIPVIMKAVVGIGAVRGEEKSKAFLDKLTNAKLKGPKANEETVKGFAEAGVDIEGVYQRIAKKLNTTVEVAKGKVKAGLVDTKTVLDAVTAQATAQFGGVADKLANSVPALINRIKVRFASLFDKFDLGPLKGALSNLAQLLEGPSGAKLKDALTRLGDTAIKALFGPFEGETGKKRLERLIDGVVRLATVTADVLTTLAPYIEKAVDGFSKLFGQDTGKGSEIIAIMLSLKDVTVGLLTLDFDQMRQGVQRIFDAFADAPANALASGSQIGGSFTDGLVSGILGGEGGAIAAIVGVVQNMINAARDASDTHSPSGAYEDIGYWNMAGLAKGQNDNADMAADASRSAMQRTVDAAGKAGGALGGGRGGAGGGPVTITINLQPPPGATAAQVGQMSAEANRRAREVWESHRRGSARDAAERSAA